MLIQEDLQGLQLVHQDLGGALYGDILPVFQVIPQNHGCHRDQDLQTLAAQHGDYPLVLRQSRILVLREGRNVKTTVISRSISKTWCVMLGVQR